MVRFVVEEPVLLSLLIFESLLPFEKHYNLLHFTIPIQLFTNKTASWKSENWKPCEQEDKEGI